MTVKRQIIYALGISLLFLVVHIIIAYSKLSDMLNLISSLFAMLLTQILAFLILKKSDKSAEIAFVDLFIFLGLTQLFSVCLLALNSAYNPYVDNKPLNFTEIVISISIFAIVLPLILSAIFWRISSMGRKNRN